MLSTNVYVKVLSLSNYIWITYLSTIYPNNSETGVFNLFNETQGKNSVFGPLRLQELKCQLWKYHGLNSIDA